MARHKTRCIAATYTVSGSRSEMLKDAVFGSMFAECKVAIRSLDLRFVEQSDPTRQVLLEIYAATVLETRFNDFKNH